jgi:hypothetical protein
MAAACAALPVGHAPRIGAITRFAFPYDLDSRSPFGRAGVKPATTRFAFTYDLFFSPFGRAGVKPATTRFAFLFDLDSFSPFRADAKREQVRALQGASPSQFNRWRYRPIDSSKHELEARGTNRLEGDANIERGDHVRACSERTCRRGHR